MKLLLLLPLAFTWAAPAPKPVRFATSDHYTLAALYQPPEEKGGRIVLLVHGVGAGKGEWDALAQKLWDSGLGTLAIDLRGHGESSGNYKTFDKKALWPSCVNDLGAAMAFLKKKGYKTSRIGAVGGSIGANLVSLIAAQNKGMPFVVLLSPGMNYRGVSPAALKDRRVYLAASPGDPTAYEAVQELSARDGGTVAKGNGHGAQMLQDSKFVDALVDWIEKTLKRVGRRPADRGLASAFPGRGRPGASA